MDTQLPISGQGLKMLIDGCTNCGTFQSIPVEDLYQEGIDEMICEYCLKERLDNDDSNGRIKAKDA